MHCCFWKCKERTILFHTPSRDIQPSVQQLFQRIPGVVLFLIPGKMALYPPETQYHGQKHSVQHLSSPWSFVSLGYEKNTFCAFLNRTYFKSRFQESEKVFFSLCCVPQVPCITLDTTYYTNNSFISSTALMYKEYPLGVLQAHFVTTQTRQC